MAVLTSKPTYTVRVSYYAYANWNASLYASDGNGGLNTINFNYYSDPTGATKTINVMENDFLILVGSSNYSYPALLENYSPSSLIKVFETGLGNGTKDSLIVYKVVANVVADLR